MIKLIAICITGVVLGAWLYLAFMDWDCQQGFKGVDTNWSYFGGCQVQTKEGTWIPRANYRSE